MTVQENRTEALDHSRRIIREGRRLLPRESSIVRQFAQHMAADAKQLHEDEDTGRQEYRYVRTAANHFSMAFTYDCLAVARARYAEQPVIEFVNLRPASDRGGWIPFTDWLNLSGLGPRW